MTDRSFARWIGASIFVLFPLLPHFAAAKDKPSLQAVQMPYVFNDDRGSNWDIQPDGTIGDGGNDLFDGGGRLSIGDAQFASNQPPQLDPETNELVFAPSQLGGLAVSRRVGCNSKLSYVRYTEILTNASPIAVKTTVHLYFNMGGTVQYANPLIDEKKSRQPVGMVIGDDSNCMALVGAGRSSKVMPRYVPQQGSDNVDVYWDVEVPAKQSLAITHLICRRANAEDGAKVLEELSDRDIVRELPADVAKEVANFPRVEKFAGDEQLLRGDLFDIVELRGGDQLKGTLKQEKYRLDTFFGVVELPAGRVIGELSSGEFRPRQLLVTPDGEIFGGKLEGDSIKLALASGQTTAVPLSQITRMGYRKRSEDDDADFKLDRPFILLRTGERMFVQPVAGPIRVATRYGTLSLKPESIAAIAFAGEEQAVHEITLTDGSKFVGLVAGDAFEMKLTTTGQTVAFPAGMLRRIQFSSHTDDVTADTATLALTNADAFIGTLTGVLKVQTAFDTLTVNGDEIRSIQRGKSAGDVQITLWDNTTLTGQPQNDSLDVSLASGVAVKAPISAIDTYTNPQPRPPVQMMERIKSLVADLNADDWKARDTAQDQLIAIGPGVARVLSELRPTQATEAQQRIDLILSTINSPKPAAPATPNDGN